MAWFSKRKKGKSHRQSLVALKEAEPENTDATTQSYFKKDFPKGTQWGLEVDRSRESRTRIILMWNQIQQFYQGNQWIRPIGVDTSLQWTRIPKPPTVIRETINLLQRPFKTLQAKLITDWPGARAVPASNSQDDILSAKASNTLLRYYWQAEKLQERFTRATRLILQYGCCGINAYWDAQQEWPVTNIINPRNLFYEDGITRPEESMWVGIRDLVHKDELKAMFPEHAKQIDKFSETDLASEENHQYGIRSGLRDVADERLEVFEVYFKDGRHGLWSNDFWLMRTECKLPEPVKMMAHTIIEDELWPMGAIEPAIGRQVVTNELYTLMVQNGKWFGAPKVMVPNDCVTASDLQNRDSAVVHVDMQSAEGQMPVVLEVPPYAAHVKDLAEKSEEQIHSLMGVERTSMGQRHAGDPTAAVAIQALDEKDEGDLQPTRDSMEQGFVVHAGNVLRLFKDYMPEEMAVKILDREAGAVVYQTIQKTQIVEDPEIFIHVGALFRDTALRRRREAAQLYQIQAIDVQELRDRIGDNTAYVDEIESMVEEHKAKEHLYAASRLHELIEAHWGIPPENLLEIPDEVTAVLISAEFLPTDDVRAYVKVFGEYISSAHGVEGIETPFIDLPRPNQMLIRRLYESAYAWQSMPVGMIYPEQLMQGPQPMGPSGMMQGPLTPPAQMPGQGPQGGPPQMTPATMAGFGLPPNEQGGM